MYYLLLIISFLINSNYFFKDVKTNVLFTIDYIVFNQ